MLSPILLSPTIKILLIDFSENPFRRIGKVNKEKKEKIIALKIKYNLLTSLLIFYRSGAIYCTNNRGINATATTILTHKAG